MKITITKGTWATVTATFIWRGAVEYIKSQQRFVFYANERQQMGRYYLDACELAKLLPDFFTFDFYTEDGIRKVMFYPKDFTELKFA